MSRIAPRQMRPFALPLVVALAIATVVAPHANALAPAEARAWIDQTFRKDDCRLSRASFMQQMEVAGYAPTEADKSMPSQATLKLLALRRVLSELKTLIDTGLVCEDPEDGTIVISKFGGCA